MNQLPHLVKLDLNGILVILQLEIAEKSRVTVSVPLGLQLWKCQHTIRFRARQESASVGLVESAKLHSVWSLGVASGVELMQLVGVGEMTLVVNPPLCVRLYLVGHRRPRLMLCTPVPYLLGNGKCGQLVVTEWVHLQQSLLSSLLAMRLTLLGLSVGMTQSAVHRTTLVVSSLSSLFLEIQVPVRLLVNPSSIGAATYLPVRREVPHSIWPLLKFTATCYSGCFTMSCLTLFMETNGHCVLSFCMVQVISLEEQVTLAGIMLNGSGIASARFGCSVVGLIFGPVVAMDDRGMLQCLVRVKSALFRCIARAIQFVHYGKSVWRAL